MTQAATSPQMIPERQQLAPYLLALPALLLFVGIVLVPIAMTVLLSFHDWGQYKGIEPVLILKNWKEVASDGYFHEMFLRTFRIALLVTLLTAVLGAPEAYILSRMRAPWRGIFLLVVLGPLLISADEGEARPCWSKLRCQVLAIGFPEMDAAPPALRAALVGDADSRSVMSDWLAQRGVRATADQIARVLAAPSRQTATPAFESDWERPGELATSLVTADRQVGYHVVAHQVVEVLYADAWY